MKSTTLKAFYDTLLWSDILRAVNGAASLRGNTS